MSRDFVTVTDNQIDKARRLLYGLKGQAPKALSRSLNRAVTSSRAQGIKDVRKEYTARATDIRKTIRVQRANPNQMTAAITSRGGALPLASFDFKPTTPNGRRRRPVRVAVKRGASQTLNRAFVARVNGRNRVFERVGKRRLPIRQLYGPSVPQMLGNEEVTRSMSNTARMTMDRRLDHEIERILNGAR